MSSSDSSFDSETLEALEEQKKKILAELENCLETGATSVDESPEEGTCPAGKRPLWTTESERICKRKRTSPIDEGRKSEEANGWADSDSDLDVDRLLELPFTGSVNGRPSLPNGVGKSPQYKEKLVLKHRSTEYFDVLPEGWIEITHLSGLPVYLHKTSRVCTFSRPYFLGPGSVRNHAVPLASIACLHQRRVRDAEKEKAVAEPHNSSDPLSKFGIPKVKVQTAEDYKQRNLEPKALHEYCTSKFDFETVKVLRFGNWADNRNYQKRKKEMLGRPSLPSHVKLITVPSMDEGSKPQQKQFFLNPQGKTSIAVLHEYVQKVLKGMELQYEFNETRNASHPYSATVKLSARSKKERETMTHLLAKLAGKRGGDEEEETVALGTGYGNSKKAAKLDAAKRALQVLVPGIQFDDDGVAGGEDPPDDSVALFDLLPLTDSRVHELSAKAGQPAPFVILQECLKRHSAFGNTKIETHMTRQGHQQHSFSMNVSKHQVEVSCTNKKEGKQKASQYMLQKLHPQVRTWGSLIRLYGYGAQRKLQETRKEKDSIIRLQSAGRLSATEPNGAILDKLWQEMRRQHRKQPPAPAALPTIDI